MNKEAAIILAAGRGRRMNMSGENKVTLPLDGKPMIRHGVELLTRLKFDPIVVVVGFGKESVVSALAGEKVVFADQMEQLGTAHAAQCGLEKVSEDRKDILIIQGDDSAFYTDKTITDLLKTHTETGAAITLLTLVLDKPAGLGRVVRDENGKIKAIVEDKDASSEQRMIHEINPACYFFSAQFLRRYIQHVEESPVSKERYLTSLVDLAIKNHEKIATVTVENMQWRGVNTPGELREAEELLSRKR